MTHGPTYWDYLRLDRLLSLQHGLDTDEASLGADELCFIVVHQAYELWFKLCLSELRLARDRLGAPHVPEEQVPHVVHHLRRVVEILRLAVEQFRLVETLTPQDFLAFRDKLTGASGFQSFQLREIEILLGLDDAQRMAYAGTNPLEHIEKLAASSPAGHVAWDHVRRARSEQTLRSALHDWLYRTPMQGSRPEDPDDAEVIDRFLQSYFAALQASNREKLVTLPRALGADTTGIEARIGETEAAARRFLFAEDVEEPARQRNKRVRAGVLFIESYRELPLLSWPRLLIDTLVEVEEGLVLFRTRHARMVERIIGRRVGTGGSSGVEYLDRTVAYRIFGELWSVRTVLLPKNALPALERPEVYGFAG